MKVAPVLRFFAAASVLLSSVLVGRVNAADVAPQLSFAERVAAQEKIERFYHSHRIGSRLDFEQAVPRAAIEQEVRNYLRLSKLLERDWGREPRAAELQQEFQRIVTGTQFEGRLRNLLELLGNDPVLIHETLVRPLLVRRLANRFFTNDREIGMGLRFESWWGKNSEKYDVETLDIDPRLAAASVAVGNSQRVPYNPACAGDDSWSGPLVERFVPPTDNHVSVWTGTEAIYWGGDHRDTGFRYDPLLDQQTPITRVGVPKYGIGFSHAAVWSGSEMIVWGAGRDTFLASGGRYNPVSDSWTPVSLVGAPSPRIGHTAVWTGTEMLIWGGAPDAGRYSPATDTWLPISQAGAPAERALHAGSLDRQRNGDLGRPDIVCHQCQRWGALRSRSGPLGTDVDNRSAALPIRTPGGLDRRGLHRLGWAPRSRSW